MALLHSFIFSLFFLCVMALGTTQAQEMLFSAYIDDVPLTEGLFEDPDSVVIFDKPAGRIIEVVAYTEDKKPSEVGNFYTQKLPEFGWQLQSEKNSKMQEIFFSKSGETLKVFINQKDGVTRVTFALSPN